MRGIWDNQSSTYGGGTTSSGSANRPNYLQTLDKRVSEADAYLQLMIEQTTVINP